MKEDILLAVDQNEIPQILEGLTKDWPKHFLLYQYVTIMEQYKNNTVSQHPQQQLFRYGGVEDGVYLLQTTFTGMQRFFIYTPSSDLFYLSKVVEETSRIPWINERCEFEGTLNSISLAIQQKKELPNLGVKEYLLLWFPSDQDIPLECLPEDVFLDLFCEKHMPEVDRNWPHRTSGSEQFLLEELKANFGIGLFRKVDKKILSSALSFHSGGISVVYTDTQSRGKGYAQVVIRRMVKELRQRGRVPFCNIFKENIHSEKLFRKIGFKEVDSMCYSKLI